jgi:hypothetical protein
MANHPTTTGAEVGEYGTLTRVMRRGFKLELEATFDVAIYNGAVWVGFFAGSSEPHEFIQVPLSLFESEEEATRWALETVELFTQNWRDAMAFEMARHFVNIGRWHLYQMGRAPYSSIDKLIAEQVKQTEKNLRQWLHRPTGRGHPSKWLASELRDMLLDILTEVNPALTWPGLREELKAREPDRTPKSGDALRVLAGRFELGLRELRRDATMRRNAPGWKAKRRAVLSQNEG